MIIDQWEHFFKPEARSGGQAFLTKGKVSFAQPSDTEVVSYIRTSTPFKVILKTESVRSKILTAECTCPPSKKGQFCKHIWAALVVTEQKNPDFFEGKIDLEKKSVVSFESVEKPKTNFSEKRAESQAAYKAKQADYRKEQYQKQKQRLKDIKQTKLNSASEDPEFPPVVEEALAFFSENGFELRASITKETVSFARKKLSRVFHPDVGGKHSEILELNKFTDILTKFAKT